MISMLLLAMLTCTVGIPPKETTASSKNNQAKKAYAKFLSKSFYNWDKTKGKDSPINQPKNYQFKCIDINGDGVQELIVENAVFGVDFSDGMRLFGFKDGKVKQILKGGHANIQVFRKKGYIMTWDYPGRKQKFAYYRFNKKGNIKKIASEKRTKDKPKASQIKHEYAIGREAIFITSCKWKNKEVSYKEYKRKVKKITKKGTYRYATRKNTKKNRNKFLK